MRILHTSDWHLGRSFKHVPLLDEQARFVDQVVEIVTAEAVDLVVVAGDVFDRGFPPAEAVEVWHDALVRIVEVWQDEAALAAHFKTPHMAAFQAAIKGRVTLTSAEKYVTDGPRPLM